MLYLFFGYDKFYNASISRSQRIQVQNTERAKCLSSSNILTRVLPKGPSVYSETELTLTLSGFLTMESLKRLPEICLPDPRQTAFVYTDPTTPGGFRKLTIEDVYSAVDSIRLHNGSPEAVRSHFETARNLALYAWFYYPFNVTAQLAAYTTIEFALRSKTADKKTKFKHLLVKAVNAGWIKDSGFSIPTQRVKCIRERNELHPSEYQEAEPTLLRDYCDVLIESIPFLRNEVAHGTSMMHGGGIGAVRISAELINQLFLPPKARD